jgi:chromate transporter
MSPSNTPDHGISLAEAVRTWAYVGLNSFGGPAGQIAVMHKVLVEDKRWIGETRFLHALNYCMLLPGPEAMQLAVYVGWLLHRTLGGLIAGILFVLPGIVCMMALSVLYVAFADLSWVQGLFYGLTGAVVVVVVEALLRISKRALKNRAMIALAAIAFFAIHVADVPFPAIVAAAALIGYAGATLAPGWFAPAAATKTDARDAEAALDRQFAAGAPAHTRPDAKRLVLVVLVWVALWFAPTLFAVWLEGWSGIYAKIGVYFSQLAVVTFGGAYAVLAYVAQQAVEHYGWLRPKEMLDGLGMAETTPGPLIMVLQFVGFLGAYRDPGGLPPLLAATLGGLLATWLTFVPCFLWIFLGAPFIERLRGNSAVAGALSAITAAVVGVVLNLAIWFALHTLFRATVPVAAGPFRFDAPVVTSIDPAALVLAMGAAYAIFMTRAGVITTLLATSAAGVALHALGAIQP